MNELISIIVPVYNVENFLCTCVTSIINQTYKNIEIILVDDGSTDRSGELCDNLALKDDRIIVLHKSNGGLSDARNYGLKYATGTYIGFVDSDDWISTKMFEVLLSNLIDYSADISVCEKVVVYETGIDDRGTTCKTEVLGREDALDVLFENKKYMSHAWNKLFRKEVFENIQFPIGKNYEDIFIMHELFGQAERIVFIDTGLYYYRQRLGSIVNTNSYKNIHDFNEAVEVRSHSQYAIGREKYVLLNFVAIELLIKSLDCEEKSKIADLEKKVARNILSRMSISVGIYANVKAFQVLCLNSLVSFIKRIKNSKYVNYIECYLDKRRLLPKTHKQRVILMGAPEYNNLGDLAIAYTMEKFFQNYKEKVFYCEYPEKLLKSRVYPLNIKCDDILCLIGGGNFGDFYMDQQNIRKNVIKKYLNNKIIIFPQTLHFSNTENGFKELAEINSILDGRDNVIVFAREKVSYDFLNKKIKCKHAELVPDIVLLNSFETNSIRENIILCLRQDIEAKLTQQDREFILNSVYEIEEAINCWDTCLPYSVCTESRNREVEKALSFISRHKLMITDRLHGMVFAAITGTPCICIANFNHKIHGVYTWISDLNFIRLIDDIREINEVAKSLLEIYPNGCGNRINNNKFEKLNIIINEVLEEVK